MTNTSLDFSRTPELSLYAGVLRDINEAAASLGLEVLIVGAVARDLLLHYAYGIPTQRATVDLDLALAVPTWQAFEQLQRQLVETGRFQQSSGAKQRLKHAEMPVDLVPFGALENDARHIVWPPTGEKRMNLFGFKEALSSACRVRLPLEVEAKVISLPALALLKLVAWEERHYDSQGKDALDLNLIVTNYLKAGNVQRLDDEFADWLDDDNFDYLEAGARMLGHDIRALIHAQDVGRVTSLLSAQSDLSAPGLLPAHMARDAERARTLLARMLAGVLGR